MLDGRALHRVVFYEITEREVREAMQNPRELSGDLVNAQQARRALDYLVGFNLSPLLWKKVQPKLSAGRVQSPALRMICEREDEIEAFRSREYWSIEADLNAAAAPFAARLAEYARRKGRAVQLRRRSRRQRRTPGAAGCRRRQGPRGRHRAQAAPAQSGPAVHHLHAAAGGLAQAGLQRPAHHDDRAATLRGRRHRRRHGRPDHLHAHGLGEPRRRGARGDPGIHQPALRQGQPPAAAARPYKTTAKNAQEAHEGVRPTSAARTPGQPAAVPDRGAVPALRPDLEAHRRLPDDARRCTTW